MRSADVAQTQVFADAPSARPARRESSLTHSVLPTPEGPTSSSDGFWLEPHSDLGIKVFTMLLYLSKDPSHRDLGTDIYDANKQRVGRSPFAPNAAMIFVPADNTFHGFEKRPIKGVRTSLIINYVTNEWRAREQLAFPEAPIA